MSIYSFSQISVYQQCPKKYQYQYVDKLEKEFKSSPDLILGTSVHGVLERLYQQVNIFKVPNKEEVLNKFYELWDFGIQEAEDNLLYKGDQKAEDYIRRGEHYINEYYDTYYPFSGIKVIGTEIKLYFSLNLDNINDNNFYGVIDRLDRYGDDTFVINDYKTNKNLPPEDKDGYREQLTLYGLGIKQKYGKYLKHIRARLHYLHFSQLDEWEITDDILNPIIEKYSKLINEIENAKAKYAESFYTNKLAFPTKTNNFCKFCEYKSICPLFVHMDYGDENVSGGVLGESTIKNLVDQYVKISKEISKLTNEKDLIKDILVKYAEEKDFEQLFGNKSTIGVSKTINYLPKNKDIFVDYLKKEGLLDKAIDIPYYKINTLVKDGDLSENDIKRYLDGNESWKLSPKNKI